jgi:TolB-like protein/Tfp pilus assembly protein PilF
MSDVFISYKAEDRARVEPLVDALEAEGMSVWWDARVGGGEAWRETITAQLEAARCVIVIWSKRSTSPQGRFVRDEASRAQRRGIYLPVTIDKVEPPLGFGETQALTLRGWKGDVADKRYQAVSECVHSILGRKRSAHPVPVKIASPAIDRRTAMAAGGAAMVALAGGWFFLKGSGAKGNTIAVLPFANLSGDPAQNYFSDGMAEEVRTALAALGGLEVVARASSEMLRNADVVTAARRLGVANVVTGSVRRSPSMIRVSAQLVDGKEGLEEWSQSFDRPIGDVLRIQSDIAANVARALSVELTSHSKLQQALGGTTNPEAQDLVLQATATNADDSSEGFLRRIALLGQAVQLDPNYADAWSIKGLNQCLWANAWARNSSEKDRVQAQALESVRRAIAIAPQMASGHSSLGLVYRNQLAMRPSLAELQRAVDLPGADALAMFNYALVLAAFSRQGQAEAVIGRALSIDPLNALIRMGQSWILYLGRRYEASVEAARGTIAIAPENMRARGLLAASLIQLGRYAEAQDELKKMPPEDYRRVVAEITIATRLGRKPDANTAVLALQSRYGDAANYQVAEIYAQVGMINESIAALELAWTKRDSGLGGMRVDPLMDPLRKDPRFSKITDRLFA